MNKLTVVISAYNEQDTLERCLKSVKWVDEIIVVDNQSTDDTAKIAKKYTQHVFQKPNQLMLNLNKNFGFSKSTNPWILNLDADEEVTADLAEEIREIINNPQSLDGYWISRRNIIFGKWIEHGIWWPDEQIRLFRKQKGKFLCKRIHEYIHIEGPIGKLKHHYNHYNYESVSQYIKTIDRCTTSESQELLESGYLYTWHDAIRFGVSDFIKIYFAQKGYKDGLHGLVLATLQMFYAFVIFLKIWEKDKFVENELTLDNVTNELNDQSKQIKYWIYSAYIIEQSNKFKQIYFRFKRKLLVMIK